MTSFGTNSLKEFMTAQVKKMTHVSCDTHDSIIRHVNVLRHTLPPSRALSASLDHTTFILMQNMSSSMCSWNLTSLAWLLFKEVPLSRRSLSSSKAVLYSAASPRLSFPAYSSLHSLECSCREICTSLHVTSMYLTVWLHYSSYSQLLHECMSVS